MQNINEFKALIKRYESITIEEIKPLEDSQSGSEIASFLTGFGDPDSCSLCDPLNDEFGDPYCDGCVWVKKTKNTCDQRENSITYDKIEYANNSEQLLEAFKERAKYMQTILKN